MYHPQKRQGCFILSKPLEKLGTREGEILLLSLLVSVRLL
jgi:hypothetical protein